MRDVSRYIRCSVERELWARAAGRCEFAGCNRLLYVSPVTQERVSIAERAHIYSFSQSGPRGWGPFVANRRELNDLANLLLVCDFCHKTIDKGDAVSRYPAARLIAWKREHEDRVRTVTGIHPNKKSHVVLYGGKIGEEESPLEIDSAIQAMFPEWYPAEERPTDLSMSSEHEDSTELFWKTEAAHLCASFEKHIRPRIKEASPNHFSIFARAGQPLLILLGALLTDKIPAEVYQLHREPISWRWQPESSDLGFRLVAPERCDGDPVLVISASAKISPDRVTTITGENASLWELTSDHCHNDLLKSRSQLSGFREAARKLLGRIAEVHGQSVPLKIFPAMPVACAVELGRIRMPKADMPWIIYEQSNRVGRFLRALDIGGTYDRQDR